ncbi:TetR/AcrR family transcriptional regulator [Prescottella agglutinans]|uniref:AcrR family transcriptional regulator n=1 Tax=Prescottella agglutinans TaxID=1644129 RepID=A0ABT6MA40_9NOCA|nr:TetR/AcrR family transcriptional regulator [Prescottella agglutinans]MDH6281167.1 AcrR family transcriptional regulator [Prescottella agglutinans]
MGRKPVYDEDRLLDTARELAAEGGPAAVTMAAVARRSGAPSGSVYHRFPDRPALLAALWLRSVTQFQAGFVIALDSEPGSAGLVAAARHVVSWCRDNPADATVLLWGAESFGRPDWSATASEALAAANGRVFAALHAAARGVGAANDDDVDFVDLAVVEVPYAIVRRRLRSGETLPEGAEDTAAEAARALLDRIES